jgi:hypothetical protein
MSGVLTGGLNLFPADQPNLAPHTAGRRQARAERRPGRAQRERELGEARRPLQHRARRGSCLLAAHACRPQRLHRSRPEMGFGGGELLSQPADSFSADT